MKDLLHRRDAEAQREFEFKELTHAVIGAAIEVHQVLGPGLLESAYEECLCHELALRGLSFRRQVELPVDYKGVRLDCGYRIDLLVSDRVVVELKCVERLLPIHEAQLLTYLRLSGVTVGLMFNFHNDVLTRGGIVRRALSNSKLLCDSAPLR